MINTVPARESIMMMSGKISDCKATAEIEVEVNGCHSCFINCLVSPIVPGIDFLLGMDCIGQLGGMCVDGAGQIKFAAQSCNTVAAVSQDLIIDTEDFEATFESGAWFVRWKWQDAAPLLSNQVASYRIPDSIKEKYDEEVNHWIQQGWLIPYSGEYDGIVPLMAIIQPNKEKVRPVLDYREVNQFISSHTANSDVCSDKLRSWRKRGTNLTLVDLRKAYLQIRVDSSLWRYQVVRYRGEIYALTRLGFGLNVAPRIMSTILNKVLAQDEVIREGTDSYVDDVIVENSVVSAEAVIEHLSRFGLEAKCPEQLEGARVLGLQIKKIDDDFEWRRGNAVDPPNDALTRRQLFSLCGQLTGHYPVAGWLRPCCSFVKRTSGDLKWDEIVDVRTMSMIKEVYEKVSINDPASGTWAVRRDAHVLVWCDASSLAMGVCLEVDNTFSHKSF